MSPSFSQSLAFFNLKGFYLQKSRSIRGHFKVVSDSRGSLKEAGGNSA